MILLSSTFDPNLTGARLAHDVARCCQPQPASLLTDHSPALLSVGAMGVGAVAAITEGARDRGVA